MINLVSFVKEILNPVRDIFDGLHLSGEEKAEAQRKLIELEMSAQARALEHAERMAQTQSSVIMAEIRGESWLQRNWRPLLMLVVIVILFNNFVIAPYVAAFGVEGVYLTLPTELWGLMTLGVGGYIGLRSYEKRNSATVAAPELPAKTSAPAPDDDKNRVRW